MTSPFSLTNLTTLSIGSPSPCLAFSQISIPIMETLSLYFLAISVRWGMFSLQGPHQVAQNSTTYSLPFSNCGTGVPLSHFADWRTGAGSPMFRYLGESGWVVAAGCDGAGAWAGTEGAEAFRQTAVRAISEKADRNV